MASPMLLVFGPQTTGPTTDYLSQLRSMLLRSSQLRAFVGAINRLPELWNDLVAHDPRLQSISGSGILQQLVAWLADDVFRGDMKTMPNVLAMPLTVIIHVVQWLHFLENNPNRAEFSQLLEGARAGGVQGFCIGLLSAVAVASAKTEEEAITYSGVALRLATCVGAYIDLDRLECDTTVLAVRWNSAESHNRLMSAVKASPDAYISVIRDTADASVTVPKSAISSLSQNLISEDISFKSVGLEGRCHSVTNKDAFQKIMALCNTRSDLSFPTADQLRIPVRSNADAQTYRSGPLTTLVLKDIMLDVSNWYVTMVSATSQLVTIDHPVAVSFGLRDCIPASIVKRTGLNVLKWRNAPLNSATPTLGVDGTLPSLAVTPAALAPQDQSYPDHSVAVVGMACRFPGADSLEEFWDLLVSGGSMCQEMPADRFPTTGLRRSPDGKLKFFGNFIRDPDAFDHRFFKKSSREAASMDPQQRILLEVAYAAMESSGYFGSLDQDLVRDIGVYIGACSNDYNDNVASHNPNAFSSLGTLRAFLSGRISHWFDWTGPSITYDTACSSSAVAIDAACKAIQVGDCSRAIAGGVSLYTNPNFYQNLAAASFLSPTGPTKPFDSRADGYCRGEGIGLVVLKKLSAAVADGDNIIGVIAGSAVNQNRNCTYITVPHGGSQEDLYQRVARQADILPQDVSYVEAHGTGTPMGDPIEFESISKVFGNENRSCPLRVASVKGNIGHLEGAAGVAALIKVCLMLQRHKIPMQANYITLNPKIAALGAAGVEVSPLTIPWTSGFRAACINNYGAAGSNAAMILREGPTVSAQSQDRSRYLKSAWLPKYPIYISAFSEKSMSSYAVALSAQVQRSLAISESNVVGNLAFNLANKQNRKLPFVLSTSVSGPEQLLLLLASAGSRSSSDVIQVDAERKKPVVLCFGGQESASVGLDKEIFDHSSVLHFHLDECDAVLRAADLPSLYPGIFQAEPVRDIISLHAMLFSLQYATAKAWMDSGLHVDTIIGHSFGQLTALCVSGSVSLSDTLKLICGRASLMKTHWGSEPGSMISLQADSTMVSNILSSAKTLGHDPEVACYNGPSSHVLVGTSAAIDAVQELVISSGSRFKRLQVTHGFHSRFTEPLHLELRKIAESMTFRAPEIPLETCSDGTSWVHPNPQLIVDHTRTAVYFNQAVQRISSRLGSCTWIEAGSSSSITAMVRGALDKSSQMGDAFVPVSLRLGVACELLADATVSLWKAGYPVQFWPFNRRQRTEYTNINLPPYQFEKSKHWLKWKDNVTTNIVEEVAPAPVVSVDPVLISFSKFLDEDKKVAEFIIDPRSKEYQAYVKGHAVLAEPLCPAPLYVELVAKAARTLHESASHPTLEDLEIRAPLGLAIDRYIILTLWFLNDTPTSTWSFEFTSQLREITSPGEPSSHASGSIILSESKKLLTGFELYERLVSAKRFMELRDDVEAEAVQGSLIYKVFERVVTYAPYYKGMRSIFSKDQQVAASVMLPSHKDLALDDTITRPLAVDNFFQVAGLHVNSLNEIGEGEVFVCTKVELIRMKPEFTSADTNSWIVYSTFAPTGDREIINDIFVFDAVTKRLVFVGLGAHFTRVSISSLARVLARANKGTKNVLQALSQAAKLPMTSTVAAADTILVPMKKGRVNFKAERRARSQQSSSENTPTVAMDVRKVLAKVAELPESDIRDDSSLDDLGIDSLMIMEVLSEVQNFFKIEIPNEDWQTLVTPSLLAKYLTSRGCGSDSASIMASTPSSNDSVSDDSDVGSHTTDTSTSSTGSSRSQLLVPKSHKDPPSFKPKPPFLRSEAVLGNAQQAFEDIRHSYDLYASQTGFVGFWKDVYPVQAKLVLAYTVEAFQELGSDLSLVDTGKTVPSFKYLEKYKLLVKQLYAILQDASLVASKGVDTVRTEKPIDMTPSSVILGEIMRKFPQHIDEHRLLHITGSKLARCLTGTDDAIKLLFRDKANRELLERVYQLGPMYEAITRQLGDFLAKAIEKPKQDGVFHVLELGGGTGGTTKHVIDFLTRKGVSFTYTFTDISGALVTAARNKFADRKNMEFTVIDVEKSPQPQHLGRYHIILSTNCIHATQSLTTSTGNMRAMLRPDGFVSIVEFTRNMFWFDLVFGLLDGWWLFQDGRKHVLADEWFWESSMRTAGFRHVTWTDGASEESRTLRIITAFAAEAESHMFKLRRVSRKHRPEALIQTVRWKQADNLDLMADIYFPSHGKVTSKPRPVALLIHGGGHVMFTRKEVNPKQIKLLLDSGFVPVSIDYRFCPEVNILEGPMTDACDALVWARHHLPTMDLNCPGLQVDGSKIAVVGWSTGGHLAMTTAFTSRQKGIQPPDAILAFYCPSDYESDWWSHPIYPIPGQQSPDTPYDLLEGVQDAPIASHYPQTNVNYPGMLMTLEDPRWRFVLHMNWRAQHLPVLLNGLPSKRRVLTTGQSPESLYHLPTPSQERIVSISPMSQILRGNYRTPTYLIHGTADDLIPWQHSQRVADALKERGIDSGIEVLDGVEHLFDTFSDKGSEEIQRAYRWLANQIEL